MKPSRWRDSRTAAGGRRRAVAAMPAGVNGHFFAAQYQRLVNPVSGAVALSTLLAAVTLPVVGEVGTGV